MQSNKPVPFNTGKVNIGCHYVPPPKDYSSPEGDMWQGVLLGYYGSDMREYTQVIIYVLSVLILAASLWLGVEYLAMLD